MSHPSKRKGSKFEREVADYLADWFPEADRKVLHGTDDRGDITGVPALTLECKAERSMNLAGYVDESMAERENAGTPFGAAVVKRRGKNVRESYVVMPLHHFADLYDRFINGG